MEPLGLKLRQQRRKLGLTLDELASKTSISKPYLSLIETGRVPNPPSDDKLRRLEQSLGFAVGELVTHANLHRTPAAVRAILNQLLQETGATGQDDEHLSLLIQLLAGRVNGAASTPPNNAVPILNSPTSGYPKAFHDLSYLLSVATDFVSCPGLTDKDAFAIGVVGDRMTPRFFDGDLVIFSPAAIVRNGDDCFVRFEDGHTAFARVFSEIGDAGESVIRLQPRNEEYRPQVIANERVAGTYRAVYRLHQLDDAAIK